jgi:hypothetical protein
MKRTPQNLRSIRGSGAIPGLYGNPDGPTRVELSVALPSVDKDRFSTSQRPVILLWMGQRNPAAVDRWFIPLFTLW